MLTLPLPVAVQEPGLARDALTLVHRAMLQLLTAHAISTADPTAWLVADHHGHRASSFLAAGDELTEAFHWLEEHKLVRLRGETIHLSPDAIVLMHADDDNRGSDMLGVALISLGMFVLGAIAGGCIFGGMA